jgi:hypothetical protein
LIFFEIFEIQLEVKFFAKFFAPLTVSTATSQRFSVLNFLLEEEERRERKIL